MTPRSCLPLAALPLIAAVAVVAAEDVAIAAPEQECRLEGMDLVCDNDYEPEPTAPAEPANEPGTTGSSGSTDDPTAPESSEVILARQGVENLSNSVWDATCTAYDAGMYYRDTVRDASTGEVLSETTSCVPDDAPDAEPAAVPVPPPPPPSRQEVVDMAAIPEPELVAEPAGRGLTGLESRFWVDSSGEVTASVELRGWTVSGSLSATSWAWDTGDGTSYETTGSGSAADPAVSHVYEATPSSAGSEDDETWPVEVETSWQGSWSISGYGLEFEVDDLATTTTGTLDYEVVEAVGVLHDVEGG